MKKNCFSFKTFFFYSIKRFDSSIVLRSDHQSISIYEKFQICQQYTSKIYADYKNSQNRLFLFKILDIDVWRYVSPIYCTLHYDTRGVLRNKVHKPYGHLYRCRGIDCLPGQYLCKDIQYCVPIEQICDGIYHCKSGDDEVNCGK